jgi:outer membrane phospholipase A
MIKLASILFLACGLASLSAHADFILSAPATSIASGDSLRLRLTITNSDAQPLAIELPAPLHLRLETQGSVATVPMTPERSGRIEIPPREFVSMELVGTAPALPDGAVTIRSTGLDANALVMQIVGARTGDAEEDAAADALSEATNDPRIVDKPPPLALSVYEPVYLLVGGDDGLNAKFQISLRYRLFDDRGPLAQRLPWIDDLYLSFSQTSLWDLDEISKPFKDSSYRPRLFYANYDLVRRRDGRLRLGLETGLGHESNGKEGDDSRSFNMMYARPTLTFGDESGLRLYFAPLIHNYIADDENPDLHRYRGYVDWQMGFGSKGGLDFWATLRKGTRSDYGSVELNASYPLSKLSGGDLTGWLMLQYFGGYGESLLDYNAKLDAQLRLGIAVAL